MAASSTRTSTNIPIDSPFDAVIIGRAEWMGIAVTLRGLLDDQGTAACEFDRNTLAAVAAVAERRQACIDLYCTRIDKRAPLVTLELDVHEDATDAELLVAARRALAADTEAVTA